MSKRIKEKVKVRDSYNNFWTKKRKKSKRGPKKISKKKKNWDSNTENSMRRQDGRKLSLMLTLNKVSIKVKKILIVWDKLFNIKDKMILESDISYTANSIIKTSLIP